MSDGVHMSSRTAIDALLLKAAPANHAQLRQRFAAQADDVEAKRHPYALTLDIE